MKRRSQAAARRLRAGRMSDLKALLALEEYFTPDHRISRRSFRRFMRSPHAKLIVATIGIDVGGCALVLYRRGSTRARLYTIAVAREFRRRGLGRRLLTAAEAHAVRRGCRSLRLEVRADAKGAVELYTSAGYRQFGRRRRYYAGRVDALRFEKPLARRRAP
ncbi:MAG TPA: GNAT family N-acetyltransferase [Xanthobacteraceae bacterium]|nr:GNAT family N-acetyltransferase [Xanthobacteraceae bacterium]